MTGDWVVAVAISIGPLSEDDEDEEFDEADGRKAPETASRLANSLWALFKRSMSTAGLALFNPRNFFLSKT
jgi:hypothetical protein